jgi:hypothetical protein
VGEPPIHKLESCHVCFQNCQHQLLEHKSRSRIVMPSIHMPISTTQAVLPLTNCLLGFPLPPRVCSCWLFHYLNWKWGRSCLLVFVVVMDDCIKIMFLSLQTMNPTYLHVKQGWVCHTVALPFTLKCILRQKKNDGNSNISPCKNIIFQKSSKRNQNPSRYYNSITNLEFQHKSKYHLSKILI